MPILLVLAADATDTLRSRYLPVLVTIGATAGTMVLWGYALISYAGPYAFRCSGQARFNQAARSSGPRTAHSSAVMA